MVSQPAPMDNSSLDLTSPRGVKFECCGGIVSGCDVVLLAPVDPLQGCLLNAPPRVPQHTRYLRISGANRFALTPFLRRLTFLWCAGVHSCSNPPR